MVAAENGTFDAVAFLKYAGLGRRIVQLKPKDVFFAQGNPADFVFYLQTGRAKLTVVSKNGKELPLLFSQPEISLEKSRSPECQGLEWPLQLPLPPVQPSR